MVLVKIRLKCRRQNHSYRAMPQHRSIYSEKLERLFVGNFTDKAREYLHQNIQNKEMN